MNIRDLELPTEKWARIAIIKRLHRREDILTAFNIARFQQQKKFWEGTSGCEDYCLYLGSKECSMGSDHTEKCDFYHYPYYATQCGHYSTAIVIGNEPGDYRSGWPQLASRNENYKELMRREVLCGLIIEPHILITMAMAHLGIDTACKSPLMKWSNTMRTYLDDRKHEEEFYKQSHALWTYEFNQSLTREEDKDI